MTSHSAYTLQSVTPSRDEYLTDAPGPCRRVTLTLTALTSLTLADYDAWAARLEPYTRVEQYRIRHQRWYIRHQERLAAGVASTPETSQLLRALIRQEMVNAAAYVQVQQARARLDALLWCTADDFTDYDPYNITLP